MICMKQRLAKDKDLLVLSGTQTVIDSMDLSKIAAQLDLTNLVEGEHTVAGKSIRSRWCKFNITRLG